MLKLIGLLFITAFLLIGCDSKSEDTPSRLTTSSLGQFEVNGTQTFLLGISYFDYMNYHPSDIDTLAARGFNTLRVFSQWNPESYGTTRSVCDAHGALQTTQRDTMQALIDYAKTKNMVVKMVILDVASGTNMDTDAKRLNCVTNVVEYFKPTGAQVNWNVLFDVVQEHDSNYSPPLPEWAGTATLLKPYTDAAKAACPSCPIFASATHINGFIGPADTTAALTTAQEAVVAEKVVTNGEGVLAVHESRSSNWHSVTGARVAEYKAYLSSIGRQNIPVIFDEPCRLDFSADCHATVAEVNQAAVQAKSSGAAMWVFHTDGSFDMSTLTLIQQLDATEAAITLSIAKALAGAATP